MNALRTAVEHRLALDDQDPLLREFASALREDAPPGLATFALYVPRAGELALELKDGSRHRLTFNLYSAETLKAVFAPYATIVDLRAVDLFLSRFAADAHWTADVVNCLPGRQEVLRSLKALEEPLCRLPSWLDHGTHLLIVAEPSRPQLAPRFPGHPLVPPTPECVNRTSCETYDLRAQGHDGQS